MTAAELERKGKSIGSTALFGIILTVITLASFVISVVSDYVRVGFSFAFLCTWDYWATLVGSNILNITMACMFRGAMRTKEELHNEDLARAKGDITAAQKYIYSNELDKKFRAMLDQKNAERKYNMYVESIRRKADKSKFKKKMADSEMKIKYEQSRVHPRQKRIDNYTDCYEKNKISYEKILSALATAKEDCVWKKVKGYKPIRYEVLFSTATKVSTNSAENYEVRSGAEFSFFLCNKVLWLLVFSAFLYSLIPGGAVPFTPSLIWSTAVKIFWGTISLYTGGTAGVDFVRQVLVPAVNGRVDFIQQFREEVNISTKNGLDNGFLVEK